MFAALNGAPLNGGANGLWGRGDLSAHAESVATPSVTRYVSAVAEPVADTTATPLRITHDSGSVTAEASHEVEATRLATGWGQAAAGAFADAEGHELVFVSGKSATAASLDLVEPWARRPMAGDASVEAITTGVGVREVWMTPAAADPVAASAGAGHRVTLAPDTHLEAGEAETVASADRTAWTSPSDTSAAAGTQSEGHIARFVTGQSVVEAVTSVDYETWWRAPLRPLRTASITWLAESRLEKLRVRQQFAEARTIVRARSRALPNTKIGRGSLQIESESRHVAGTLRMYRDARGVTASSATGASVPSRITVISGNPTGIAETRISPTVTRGGTTYRYADGRSIAVSEHQSVGHRITEATGQPTVFSESVGESYQVHAFTGTAEAGGDVPPVHRAHVNPWVRATGQSVGVSDQSATMIRQDFVTVEELVASAKSSGGCYREVLTWDSTTATASMSADATRLAKVEGYDDAISTVDISADIYRWRYPVLEPLAITSGGRDRANKIARYVDETMEPGSEIHCDAARLAIPQFDAQPNDAISSGTEPDVTRYVYAASVATVQTEAVSQPYRFITAPSIRAKAQSVGASDRTARYVEETALVTSSIDGGYDLNAFVRHIQPAVLDGQSASVADGLRITFIEPARIAESWAETGRVSYQINPDSPAPESRTITLMPGARVMSVPASVREYQVA